MSLWQILSWQALFIFIIVFLSGDLEVEASKKQAELDKKAMDELLRERDILNKERLLQ